MRGHICWDTRRPQSLDETVWTDVFRMGRLDRLFVNGGYMEISLLRSKGIEKESATKADSFL